MSAPNDRSMVGLYSAAARRGATLLLAMAAACGGQAEAGPGGAARLAGDFVSVRKALRSADLAAPVAGLPSADGDFYIAIEKSALAQRWFLSATMKQFYPDNLPLFQFLGVEETEKLLAASPLGTRVVSFSIQNDRLYMFDTSDRFHETPLQDPTVLLEAYPIVEQPEFSALPGADDYVLFDPSQGLNAFRLTGATFADPYLEFAAPLSVGLAFSQNFRALPDGAAFEEVFAGQFDVGAAGGPIAAWGTLGIALRRYRESESFSATPAQPFYFSNFRYAEDGTGQLVAEAIHWNFQRGMSPVEVFVSAGADRAQQAYPEVDILGAITEGIESWNDAFGFPVFRAVFTHDDVIRDDGSSFVLVDYPGPNDTAIGPVQVNPNNGEILSANVYLSRGAFDLLDQLGLSAAGAAPPEARAASAGGVPAARARAGRPLEVTWSGMSPAPAACDRGSARRARSLLGSGGESPMASLDEVLLPEVGKAWVQDFVVHEIGHTLGLAHNFKGSLVAPGGSTVMDYQTPADAVALAVPGTYDIAAIRYLYQLSGELPSDPFCSDGDLSFDPTCQQFDEGADPLGDYWAPEYALELDFVLDQGGGVDGLSVLNDVLAFARDADPGFVSPETRVAALALAFGRAGAPLGAEDAASPEVAARADLVAEAVLRRALLDPPEARGSNVQDIGDPGVLALLIEQAGLLLRNTDGVRGYAVRRTAADTLAALQSDAALVELRNSRDQIAAASNAALSDIDRQLTADLLARVDTALDPYFR